MRRLQFSLFFFIALPILWAAPALAQDTSTSPSPNAGRFRLSAMVGEDTLFSDPGSLARNAFAFAVSGNYKLADDWALDVRYLMSSHSSVTHSEVSLGADYSLEQFYYAFPYVSAGLSVVHNDLRDFSRTGDAAGLYVGVGAAFDVYRNVRLGPAIRYFKAFSSRAGVGASEIDTVGDSFEIGLRILYTFADD